MRLNVSLDTASEVGVFADFAAVWHTQASFVIDFVVAKHPLQEEIGADGKVTGQAILEARVASRVRIPPEQIGPLRDALNTQLEQWLKETGRAELPPAAWYGPGQGVGGGSEQQP